MVKVSSLLLLIASLFLVSMEEAKMAARSPLFFPTRHVIITNDLGEGVALTIHCKSKDDLGVHDLSFHSSFSWKFRTNPFLCKTLFYCYLWWGNVSGSFDVYSASRDDERCINCKWSIKTDGAYMYDEDHEEWDLLYQWPKS